MKKLTDILLIVLFCILAMAVTAQDLYIQGGYNLTGSGSIFPDGKSNSKTTMKQGFHIGASLETPLSRRFSMVTSAQLTTKGWIYKFNEHNDYNTANYTSVSTESHYEESSLYFIDLPLTFQYRMPLDWKTSLYFMGGPYLGIGIYGEVKYKYTYTDITSYGDIGYYEDSGTNKMSGPFTRLDIGHTVGAGIQHKDVRIGLTYDFGISPMISEFPLGSRVLKFTLGYKLN